MGFLDGSKGIGVWICVILPPSSKKLMLSLYHYHIFHLRRLSLYHIIRLPPPRLQLAEPNQVIPQIAIPVEVVFENVRQIRAVGVFSVVLSPPGT